MGPEKHGSVEQPRPEERREDYCAAVRLELLAVPLHLAVAQVAPAVVLQVDIYRATESTVLKAFPDSFGPTFRFSLRPFFLGASGCSVETSTAAGAFPFFFFAPFFQLLLALFRLSLKEVLPAACTCFTCCNQVPTIVLPLV